MFVNGSQKQGSRDKTSISYSVPAEKCQTICQSAMSSMQANLLDIGNLLDCSWHAKNFYKSGVVEVL